ncbi:MAG: NAD-dependent epimerase/dehydratase family protein [Planctomycetota bacterium]
MQKVLVTGGAGYVGSWAVRKLLESGFAVRVLDSLLWGDSGVEELYDHPMFELVEGDVRDTDCVDSCLRGVEHVVHLAAIVGDPACAKEPETARAVNEAASKQLYDLAQQAGVRRFVFASTCSNYGKMAGDTPVDEDSELRPVSLYAELKVAVEEFLLSQTGNTFPVCLRFATAYGRSPRMRFDLTVNEFTKIAALGEELAVFGEQFWRPYCHVEDLGRAVSTVLTADQSALTSQVFNIGYDDENYRKGMIVEAISAEFPEVDVQYVSKDEDPRDYRVAFRRARNELGFAITRTVPDGIREIRHAIESGAYDFEGTHCYSNV